MLTHKFKKPTTFRLGKIKIFLILISVKNTMNSFLRYVFHL